MPNQFADAFAQLSGVRESVLGAPEQATIGAETVDVIMGIMRHDGAFVVGARRENGGFDLQVAISALAAEPAQMSKVTFNGESFSVTNVDVVNGATYTITCGDPAQ